MRRPLIACAAAIVAVCLTACGSGSSTHGSAGSSTYKNYVALGDSYTAAPYVHSLDTTSVCGRSPVNYPHLLAKDLGVEKLTDVSCGGATTADITGSQKGLPPQLDAVTADTDLVTIGIGGNDYRVSGVMLFVCPVMRVQNPAGDPCRSRWSNLIDHSMPKVQHNVVSVLRKVRDRAPHARIIVVDYPQLIAASGGCTAVPIADGDVAFVRGVVDKLDDAVLAAARKAKVDSLDLRKASQGHDVCSKDPWINGMRNLPGTAAAMHPMANEQRAVAELLAKKLEG
jgi:lysophospholipase L1-like esterase